MSESDIQKACVQWLNIEKPRCIWYAVPNGGHRNIQTAARLKAEGVRAGVADFAFVLPGGRAAFIELKTPEGRMSQPQQQFRDDVRVYGGAYLVATSLTEFIGIVQGWTA